MLIPQLIIGVTLIAMLSGKAPLYLTAIVGATLAALAAGFPISGVHEGPVITGLLAAGMHGVIFDMMGVLLFIGIMDKVGFLNAIIVRIMAVGKKIGGGPGICALGGFAAGALGAMTGFTQPAITAVIAGPPAVALGVDKNKVCGAIGHANTMGNFAGFTHPTQVAVIATAGITFGVINVVGLIVGLSIISVAFFRLRAEMKRKGEANAKLNSEESAKLDAEFSSDIPFLKAIFPFGLLVVGFASGLPIVLVGVFCALVVVLMTIRNFVEAEQIMMQGLTRITVPLLATFSFLYMSAVISAIGLVALLAGALEPALNVAPIIMMLTVSALTGLITQSNAASMAIVIPFLTVVLASGANPVAAAVVAAGGPAIMQLFLTGGPVAGLATVIPVMPGSDLKLANRFQRPNLLVGLAVLLICGVVLAGGL